MDADVDLWDHVCFRYRLAPEFPYPIPIQDCYNATFYALDNMNMLNLNIDLSRVFLAGDSAGKLLKRNQFWI